MYSIYNIYIRIKLKPEYFFKKNTNLTEKNAIRQTMALKTYCKMIKLVFLSPP